MDSCFVPCGWKCGFGRLSKIEKDRYTDCIDNVLKDKHGRELFKHFIENRSTFDSRASLDVLNFWENVTSVLSEYNDTDKSGCSKEITDRAVDLIQNILDDADLADEIDLDLAKSRKMKRACEDFKKSGKKEVVVVELADLDIKAKEALHAQYKLFKNHLKSL